MKGFLRVIFRLAIYGAVGTCLGEKPTAPFAIAISTPNHVVNSGSDVRLDIVMTNTSDHEFPIGRAIGDNQAELDYHIRVLDDRGKSAAETEYGRKVYGKDGFRFGSVFGDRLRPGDTLHEYTILSRISI
jgi:hypothetical protein